MLVFTIRRLMQSAVVVLVMSFLVFGGVNIVGDPVEMMVSDEADQEEPGCAEGRIEAKGARRRGHGPSSR